MMLKLDCHPVADVVSTNTSNRPVASPLFAEMQFHSCPPLELPWNENPSSRLPYATSLMCCAPVEPVWSNPWSPLFQDTFSTSTLPFDPFVRSRPVSSLS